MNITLPTMVKKYNNCVNALDETKNCDSCKYKKRGSNLKPCNSCWDVVLGMPINPTNWKKKP